MDCHTSSASTSGHGPLIFSANTSTHQWRGSTAAFPYHCSSCRQPGRSCSGGLQAPTNGSPTVEQLSGSALRRCWPPWAPPSSADGRPLARNPTLSWGAAGSGQWRRRRCGWRWRGGGGARRWSSGAILVVFNVYFGKKAESNERPGGRKHLAVRYRPYRKIGRMWHLSLSIYVRPKIR